MINRITGKASIQFLPKLASTIYSSGSVVYPNGTGAIINSTSFSNIPLGILNENVLSTDSDYSSSTKKLSVDMFSFDGSFEMDASVSDVETTSVVSPYLTNSLIGNRYNLNTNKTHLNILASVPNAPFQVISLSRNKVVVKYVGAPNVLGAGLSTENVYTKALFFGNPLPQAGSVKDFSQNSADAVYSGTTTDAEVYNTEAGLLTVLGGAAGPTTAKALCIEPSKFQWNLAAGESLFLQMRFKLPTLVSGAHFVGNCSIGTIPGFLIQHATAGTIQIYIRCGASGAQLIGSSTDLAVADTLLNMTLWIDGTTKLVNGWINGKLQANWTNKAFSADGTNYTTINPAAPGSLVLGNSGDIVFPNQRLANAVRFAAFRVANIPAGRTIQNAALLDWRFNRDHEQLFTDADLSLV